MRTPRIVILILFLASSLFLLARAVSSSARAGASPLPTTRTRSEKSIWGFLYYNTPFSLFPPNAAISLTDDNSTTFAARPAAFGGKLDGAGLSGQLWVGSGFPEDAVDGEGELGCSDLPGWDGTSQRTSLKDIEAVMNSRIPSSNSKTKFPKRSDSDKLDRNSREGSLKSKLEGGASPNDGTDDYLHDGLKTSSHADIQSIQEAAEIQGKVVLLMRGGCGFLEKVMWAQRRGAIAVIVGDNQKGGPLIQMFAHGDDVDNVTIPSVFTARTTAHLLSSLTQPGSFIEDSLDDSGRPVLKVQHRTKPGKTPTKKTKTGSKPAEAKGSLFARDEKPFSKRLDNRGWFSRMFRYSPPSRSIDDKSLPPRSGRIDWVMVADWNEEGDRVIKETMDRSRRSSKSSTDGFVIGVEDWRDPDLLKPKGNAQDDKVPGTSKTPSASDYAHLPKGGSITPSSGEYNAARVVSSKVRSSPSEEGKQRRSFIAKLFGTRHETEESRGKRALLQDKSNDVEEPPAPKDPAHEPHEGLWVTITPTSSASPFFDTLLVLVISPLVTLTVVYALLILRARIRRRRWRAPKSVVDRLPVRTYHTVAASPTPSTRLPSPSSTSPSTPLLQQSSSQSRPRSRTTTGVLESENLIGSGSTMPAHRSPSRGRGEHEKFTGISPEWRKYMSRQVECVVCLEEYVDGISRVMSLPCGHEFHADCITPWLTTRRRTCPICKGDVVRSLAHSSSSGNRYDPYQDSSDDEAAAEGSSSRPIAPDPDPEQGILSEQSDTRQEESWLNILSRNINGR
ncbi:unnamed protein product [Clonostachys rosea f. rosea IK726]|uniref:RING-type E3 ubiquitin transferase n=2 Tax=Bionectria ochroleuca TaxID=29856 RepID=A0A0B7KF70_BIOOC|nr:unnamed protein product [Clonostachys rosea f. rosea IK726]